MRKKDVIVSSMQQVDTSNMKMPIISAYGTNQIEYPGKYVARVFDAAAPTNTVIVADNYETLKEIIESSMPVNMSGVYIPRTKDDDPSLIGCWI